MVKEVELALVKRQLAEAKEVIADLQADNTMMRDRIIQMEAQRQNDYADIQNTISLKGALKDTVAREREAAAKEERTRLQEELKRITALIKENEFLRDIENKDQKLLNYTSIEISRAGGKAGQNEIVRLTEKIKQLTLDKNKLSNDLENVLAENALLRQMSKVPDNFGEMIEAYKIDQKDNAIYYKRKNEYLEKEIRELEEEKTRLRTELRKFAGFFARTDAQAQGLNDEQQRYLEDVIINLKQGKFELPLSDKSKALQEQVIKLQAIVSTYENITGNLRHEGTQSIGPAQIDQQQMQTILEAIKDQRKEMEDLFASMRQNEPREERQETNQSPSKASYLNNTLNNTNRPPRPIAGIFGDWTETNQGMSYKFNTKLQLKTYDEELAGMDIDKAKYYIAALQLHNMESMELLHQREKEYQLVTHELEELRSTMRKALLLQDELFVKHHFELSKFDQQSSELKKENLDLKTLNMELSHRSDMFERSLAAIQSKSPAVLEGRLAEMTKNAAIAETNIIKLSRKYDALESEHNDVLKVFKVMDGDKTQREYQLVEKMNKLLEWKNDATEKIKILLERVRNSVPADEHNSLRSQLELERQKYAALKANENVLIQQNSEMRGYEREKSEANEKLRKVEEELAGLEAEYGVLHLRLSAIDPVYNRHSLIFKKIASVLKNNNLSPLQFFQTMDTDKSGTLSSNEFAKALESMGIQMRNDEADTFFKFIDLDGSGQVDYTEFCRKLKRMGVAIRSKEEEVVNKLWTAIVKSGLTLERAYEVIDSKKQNNLTFNEMMAAFKTLNLQVDDRSASEFFRLADVSDNGSISCAEFVYVFKRFNKVSQEALTPESTLDWKLEMMARLDKVCKDKNVGLEQIFKDMDSDGDDRVTEDEFRRLFLKMGLPIERNEFKNLFFAIDSNRSGAITFPEFLNYVNVAKKEQDRLMRMKLFDKQMKDSTPINNDSLVMDSVVGGFNDPSTRFQLKIAQIEAKEKSARRQLGEYSSRITRMEQESGAAQSTIKSLEGNNLRLQQELIKEKERTMRLERLSQASLTKEQSTAIRAANENYRIEGNQLRSALDTFRSLHEAAVREAKSLRMSIGRNDDENIHLRREIRELQSQSDENALIGKLFNQVLTEKWTEAAFNKRFDQSLDDLRKAQIEASNLSVKLKKKETELFDIQTGAAEKIALLEKQLFEARMCIFPSISLSKLEELNLALKRLANQKLELEIANKTLRNNAYETQVRLDNYILREQNLKDLEIILKSNHPDELSHKVIELSEKLAGFKLNELKAQREVSLIREREEYYMRVNKTQTIQIQALEEQVASNETKFNERENFWRARFQEQLTLMARNDSSPVNKVSASTLSNDGMRNLVRDEMIKGGSKEDQIILLGSPRGKSGNSLNASTLEMDNQVLRDKITFLQDDNKYKDLKIEKLEKEMSTRGVGIHYNTDKVETLVINDLETKTREIAQAAQHTVQTLQQIIEEKSKLVEEKEKKIDNLRAELSERGKTMSRLELENENLRRQVAMSENTRMNVEQYTTLRTIEKINNMDQKEIERMVATYQNKLTILAEELTQAERVNKELMQNLRTAKGEAALLHNNKELEANMTELDQLRKDNLTKTDLYKKKCAEIKRLNEVLKKYSEDLSKQEATIERMKVEEGKKVIVSKNEGGHYEERIAVLTSKFTALNDQFKEEKKHVQELKTNEIRYREKINDLNEQLNKVSAMNAQLKDENAKLSGKRLANPTQNTAVTPVQKTSTVTRRPSSAAKTQPATTPLPTIATKQSEPKASEEVYRLREENTRLLEENSVMRNKLNQSPGTQDFIDENGCLYQKNSMAFKSREELVDVLRKYLEYVGPSTNLFAIMKKADPKKQGVAPIEAVLNELSNSGVKFRERDRAIIPEYIPKDPKGLMDYKAFYYMIKGNLQDFSAGISGQVSNTGFGATPTIIQRGAQPKDSHKEAGNVHSAVLDRNVDLLKKKLTEKDREVTDLTNQLKHWKQTALNYENELKDKNNTGRNMSYGLNSTLEAKLGRKGESLKQIQDLEEQVRALKKELKYEIDKREQVIKEQQDDLSRRSYDLALSHSECSNLRSQLDRVMNSRLQKDQLLEERDKEKDLLVAGLMERLEKTRKSDEDTRNKLRAVERENIDLKHIKEGIDTRLENLNREIRELKDKKRFE